MTFERARSILFELEGGEVNDPRDPGGHTKYGISARAYPNVDIANLTLEVAGQIYKENYWDAVNIEKFPKYLQLSIFDFCVNSGRGNAIRALQRAIGVADDGTFGPISSTKLASLNPKVVLFKYNEERLRFLRKLSTWPTYGNGWTTRVFRILAESVEMPR